MKDKIWTFIFGQKFSYNFYSYFENLAIRLYVFYVLNTQVKFIAFECYLLFDL